MDRFLHVLDAEGTGGTYLLFPEPPPIRDPTESMVIGGGGKRATILDTA